MRVVQKVFPDNLLKIPFLCLLTQCCVGCVCLDMDKGLIVIIKPAVEQLQSVHQSLRCRAEICLAVLEFVMVDRREQSLLVEAVLYNALEHFPDDSLEFLFPVSRGSLCHHAEEGLLIAIVIDTEDILADTLVDQRLLQGRSRHGAECKIQHLHRNDKLPVQTVSRREALCKISILLRTLPLSERNLLHKTIRLFKAGLLRDLGVHLEIIIF